VEVVDAGGLDEGIVEVVEPDVVIRS